MSFWILGQIFLNLILLAAVGFIWARLNRPAKDDPRLSRGLQLLQSKISVLEDLSDRTEIQVSQLTSLMEQKCRDIQSFILQADRQVQKIETSMSKSLEVAKIFQDKIPHQEIIERQNTLKYIKAARLAHRGHSVEEIAAQVDLSQGEIEFIAKVNRDQLQFSEEDLPAWAQEELEDQEPLSEELIQPLRSPVVQAKKEDQQVSQALSHLGDQFRNASGQFSASVPVPQTMLESSATEQQPPTPVQMSVPQTNGMSHLQNASAAVVKKVVFPRIDGSRNLG